MTAPEAHHLDILQPVVLRREDGRGKHPRMEIVDDVDPAPGKIHPVCLRQGIRRQHRDPGAGEHLRKVVVHQGVVLIGPGRQHHRVPSLPLHLADDLGRGCFQGAAELAHGVVARGDGFPHLRRRDPEFFLHPCAELGLPVRVRIPVEQGRVEGDPETGLRIIRIPDNNGIALHHRAHGLTGLFPVLRRDHRHRRHEDPVHTHLRQGAQMPVHQLCREADRVGGDCLQAVLVDLPGTHRGHLHPEPEIPEKGRPEGHVVPEGKDPRKADDRRPAALRLRNGILPEQKLLPQPEQVRDGLHVRFFFLHLLFHRLVLRISQDLSPLAAVVGDPGAPVGEADDSPAAVISAEGAGRVRVLSVGEIIQRIEPRKRFLQRAGIVRFLCEKGCADGAHDAGIRRADHLMAHILLQRPENRVVLKGAALDHDPASQGVQIRNTDDLGKHVFDDGTAETRHNVARQLPVPLFRDDAGIHEDRAAAAEERRVLRREGLGGDGPHRDLQGRGEILQEGAAARRTGLVHHDVRDDAVIQPDGLHILAADVQQEGGILHILLRRPGMGNGLDKVALSAESLVEQKLPITCGACSKDLKLRSGIPVALPHGDQRFLRHHQRLACVRRIERVQELPVLSQQHELRRRGTGIHAEERPEMISRLRLCSFQFVVGMAGKKVFPLRIVFEEYRGLFGTRADLSAAAVQLRRQFPCPAGGHPVPAGLKQERHGQCGAVGDDDFRMRRDQDLVLVKLQTLCEHPDQGRVEVQRTALEDHRLPDVQSLGQSADSLLRDGMEGRERKVFLRCALVQQRLNVRLREHAAAS